MKKYLCLFGIILFFLAAPYNNLKAAPSLTKFSLNVGGLTGSDFDIFYWTAGAAIDINLANIFMISPEGFVMGYKFDFDYFIGFVGGTGNITFGSGSNKFFLGAGPLLVFPINWTTGSTALTLKLQAGLISGGFRMTAYAITDWEDPFSGFAFGATLGIVF